MVFLNPRQQAHEHVRQERPDADMVFALRDLQVIRPQKSPQNNLTAEMPGRRECRQDIAHTYSAIFIISSISRSFQISGQRCGEK